MAAMFLTGREENTNIEWEKTKTNAVDLLDWSQKLVLTHAFEIYKEINMQMHAYMCIYSYIETQR